MKHFLLFVSICCLLAACNRPMLQLPATPTTLENLVADTNIVTAETAPLPSDQGKQPVTMPQATANAIQPPTMQPTRWPSATIKPAATPYPTPVWCPVVSSQPVISGKLRLAYASQGNLWLWDEGGSTKQLSTSGDIKQVSLSDDGKIIAFTRLLDENHEELWGIQADGKNERRLLTADDMLKLDGSKNTLGILPWGLQWEPKSHNLIFYIYPIYDGVWIFQPSVPWLADMDSGKVSAAPYYGGQIAFSPNGEHVIIYNTDGLSLVNIDGSNLRQNILPAYHGIGEGESYYYPQPFWASDSASFMVAIPDQDDLYNILGTVTIWRVPVDEAPENIGQWKVFAPSVQFSPDLSFLTYWLWPKPAKNLRELHFVWLQRSTPDPQIDSIYVTGDLVSDLVWSPDAHHFIFEMGNPDLPTMFFYTGEICQRPKQLLDGEYGGVATWVDSSRFLIEIHGEYVTDEWELRLGKLDQEQAEKIGVVTNYDWVIHP